MTLPPRLRSIQQSAWFHVAQSAALAGVIAYVTCSPQAHPEGCLSVGIGAFVGALYLSFQHSPGSTAFASNGTPIEAVPQLKELVDDAITVHAQAAAATLSRGEYFTAPMSNLDVQDPNVPMVQPLDAAKASAAVEKAVAAVSIQAAVVKTQMASKAH